MYIEMLSLHPAAGASLSGRQLQLPMAATGHSQTLDSADGGWAEGVVGMQQSCSDASSFDLRADLLADCIREVEAATRQANLLREAGKRRQYDGLGLRVRFHPMYQRPACV